MKQNQVAATELLVLLAFFLAFLASFTTLMGIIIQLTGG